MQAMLTGTLILAEDVTSINEFEAAIQAWGRALMREMVAVVWQQLTKDDQTCPA